MTKIFFLSLVVSFALKAIEFLFLLSYLLVEHFRILCFANFEILLGLKIEQFLRRIHYNSNSTYNLLVLVLVSFYVGSRKGKIVIQYEFRFTSGSSAILCISIEKIV